MKKKLVLTSILTLCVTLMALAAVTKSQVVVYVNGVKYYIHTVQSKETLYSLAKLYEVSEQVIIDNNSAELMAGENIKIPYETTSSDNAKEQMGGIRRMMTFKKHTIKKGQTLYSISREYEISIETIMEDNPTLDPLHLTLGETILIRKKMTGKSSEEQSLEEWDDYRSNLSSATQQDGYIYHIVKKGETIYSLSREAGLSEEEFIELNNLGEGLKSGAMVKMPADNDDGDMSEEEVAIEQLSFKKLQADQTLKVALMLPLSSGTDRVHRQFADLYKGFVMGLNSVKAARNCNIELVLYNTERNEESIRTIVESPEFEGTNLIVGPIYEELLAPVLEYAQKHHTPVVSPLATLRNSQSSVLFQLAPPAESKYEKVKEMVADTKHITLIYTEKNDSKFEQSIKTLLGERPYDTHVYEYEHPTVVAEKIRDEEESAGDLSKFINNDKENTIIIMSDNETDVDRILSALSSAQINIVARGGKAPKYRVLGNSDWSKYNNIDRTVLFKNNVVLLSSYHTKRDNTKVVKFDSDFIAKHGTLPTLYAYRGYDAAMIFGDALYSDIEYNLEGRLFTPLQSQYRFEADSHSGIHVNTEWLKVNYKSNYTIILE